MSPLNSSSTTLINKTTKRLLNETPNGSSNFHPESPSQESKGNNLATRAAKKNKERKNVIAVGDSMLDNISA